MAKRGARDRVEAAPHREGDGTAATLPGAPIAAALRPRPRDFVVLKSTLSGFYQTPLATMLHLSGVRTLVLCGFAADNCVLFTAADAYMRDYRIVVPCDAVGAQTPDAQGRALRMMHDLLSARIVRAAEVRLTRK